MAAPPQLYCASHLRYLELSDQVVLLDLSAGTYDMVDSVGAVMWGLLLRDPDERDLAGVAAQYGVDVSVIEADLEDFAAAQQASRRLVTEPPRAEPPGGLVPRRKPTLTRALRERASVQRELQRGFADAYAARTAAAADVSEPRVDVPRLVKLFRTADGLFPSRQAPLDCLPRSLALTRFLRTAGWPAEHVIGVALYPFEAHAWVQLDGVAIDENPSVLRRYVTIARA